MAFTYQTKSWSIQGEKKLDDIITLLNPTLTVQHITIVNNTVSIGVKAIENGGVYEHRLGIQYTNTNELTDIDAIVDSAVSQAFPEAIKSA